MQDNRLMPLPAVDRGIDRPLPDLTQVKSYGPAANEPTQFRDYLFIILKRKWLILSLCLVVTSLVAVQMFRQPSIYEAETTIRIEQRKSNVLQTDKFIIGGQPDPNFWGTQLKLLESPALARQVVLTLDLQHNPEFVGAGPAQGGFFAKLKSLFSREKAKPILSPAAPSGLELVSENKLREQPLTPQELAALEPYEDMIIGNEEVSGILGTNLFTIKYKHSNPQMAQKIANTLAEVFAFNNLERSTFGSNNAQDLLSRQIATLQTKIRYDQERQFNYAREHNLSLSSGQNVDDQRLQQLSSQLLQAQNDRKTAQAVYDSARSASDPFSIPQVQASGRVANLRERLSVMRERRDTLLVVYTKEWPEVRLNYHCI